MKQSTISIETFVKNNWLEEIKKSAPAPVVVPPPPPPAPVVETKSDVIPDAWDQKHTVKPQEKPKPPQQPKKPVKAEVVATGSTKDDTNKFEDSAI